MVIVVVVAATMELGLMCMCLDAKVRSKKSEERWVKGVELNPHYGVEVEIYPEKYTRKSEKIPPS